MPLDTLTPAPSKRRTLAGLIDLGLIAGYIVVVAMLVALVFPHVIGPVPFWVSATLALLFIEVPIGVWWWRQESTAATTIGKRVQQLRVIRCGTREAASSPRCAVRALAKLTGWAIIHILTLAAADPALSDYWWWSVPCLALVATLTVASLLMAYVRIDHRTGYDLIAGTQVVEAD